MDGMVKNHQFFTDFKTETADDSKIYLIVYNLDNIDDFDEKNYSLKFNLPSIREFGNVYIEDCITLF
jgi:hypothetical protein